MDKEQTLQENEYSQPAHWRLGYVDRVRYEKMSRHIAGLVSSMPCVQERMAANIIDVGCGDGLGSFQVWKELKRKSVDVHLSGCDYSSAAIRWALEMTQSMSDVTLTYECKEVEAILPGKGGQSLIVILREVVEHLREEEIDQFLQNLKKAGVGLSVVITAPSINSPTEAKHYRHYSSEMLENIFLRNGFRVSYSSGFGFRPRGLFPFLVRMNTTLNTRKRFAWLMKPLWRKAPPSVALTLVGVGEVADDRRSW